MHKHFRSILLIAALFCLASGGSLRADEYSFTVENKTDSRITKILVSEDGKSYGFFDIGGGIKPGQTVKLVWSDTTNGENCTQWIKAVYADESEAEATKFDFCEKDLEIVFE